MQAIVPESLTSSDRLRITHLDTANPPLAQVGFNCSLPARAKRSREAGDATCGADDLCIRFHVFLI